MSLLNFDGVTKEDLKKKSVPMARIPKKLDVARNDHVVIPLPASYEICNN